MAVCSLPYPASFSLKDFSAKCSGLRLGWRTQFGFSCRAVTLAFATKNSRFVAQNSAMSPRRSRAKKNNAELCNELREFILVSGFPEHHVPKTKELLEHGRKDLADIVRRRGHGVIAKLLGNNPDGEIVPDAIPDEQFTEGKNDEELQCATTGVSSGYSSEVISGFDQNGGFENNAAFFITAESIERKAVEAFPGINCIENAEGDDSQLTLRYQEEQDFISQDAISDKTQEEFHENSSFEKAKAEADEEQAKINHLRELLRNKELELSLLKQQLEEEKLALSAMREKVQSELSKIDEVISSKDQELQSAEEGLSGLKEVLIDYWGNAETVEVTGSFNGWQHKLALQQEMTSNTVNPLGTREAMMWSTVLWLYPGVYEIKFIVDGHWKIDPQKEFVSRDNVVNNILRVSADDDPTATLSQPV